VAAVAPVRAARASPNTRLRWLMYPRRESCPSSTPGCVAAGALIGHAIELLTPAGSLTAWRSAWACSPPLAWPANSVTSALSTSTPHRALLERTGAPAILPYPDPRQRHPRRPPQRQQARLPAT
jgi:hypothetical protein